MKPRHLHHAPLCFERTLDAAFRTPRYAAPIERPWPSLWSRLLQSIREILR